MLDLVNEASALGSLLEETRGVVGIVVATSSGEPCSVIGSFVDGNATAGMAAQLTTELATIGAVLGLGAFEVASLKAPTGARVFAAQGGAVLAIELDPRSRVAELEAKLRATAWAPTEAPLAAPAESRVPTIPLKERITGSTQPPPTAAPPDGPGAPSPAVARAPARPTLPSGPIPTPLKSAGSGPVFSGDLEELSVPDVLEFLRSTHRTGVLTCTTIAQVGTVQLARGMIAGAASPNALDLRDYLLTSAQLSPAARLELADLPRECFDVDAIDGALVSRGLVTHDEVARSRVARIYSALREMVTWATGRFSFDPSAPVAASPALVLSVQSVLMQIYQEQDEQGQ